MMVHKVLMLLVSILGIIYSFKDPKALNFIVMAGQIMNYLFLYNEKPLLDIPDELPRTVPFGVMIMLHCLITQKITNFIFTRHTRLLCFIDSIIMVVGLVQYIYGLSNFLNHYQEITALVISFLVMMTLQLYIYQALQYQHLKENKQVIKIYQQRKSEKQVNMEFQQALHNIESGVTVLQNN